MVMKGGTRKREQLSIRRKKAVHEQVTEFTYLGFDLNEKLSLARLTDPCATASKKLLCF